MNALLFDPSTGKMIHPLYEPDIIKSGELWRIVEENLKDRGYELAAIRPPRHKDEPICARFRSPDGREMGVNAVDAQNLVHWSETFAPELPRHEHHPERCLCVECRPIIRGMSETVGAKPKKRNSTPTPSSTWRQPWDYPPMESRWHRKMKSLRFRLTGKTG